MRKRLPDRRKFSSAPANGRAPSTKACREPAEEVCTPLAEGTSLETSIIFSMILLPSLNEKLLAHYETD